MVLHDSVDEGLLHRPEHTSILAVGTVKYLWVIDHLHLTGTIARFFIHIFDPYCGSTLLHVRISLGLLKTLMFVSTAVISH